MRQVRSLPQAVIVILGLLVFVGCNPVEPDKQKDSTKAQSNKEQQNAESQNQQPETPATREELDSYLSGFGNAGSWNYGERVIGELAGTWISTDGDGHKIVFNENGKDGSFSEDFNGAMSKGVYAISNNGKIVAYSKSGGVGIGSHFQFDGKIITGPKGPNPSASWERMPE